MDKKLIVLCVLAALVLGVYGWVWLRPGPPIEVDVLATPGGATFMFNGTVALYEVKVTALPGDADGSDGAGENAEGEVVWHLVPREVEGVDPVKVSSLSYGQAQGLGLRPAEGMRMRGRRLEPGVRYVFEADTSSGEITATFEKPGGPPA